MAGITLAQAEAQLALYLTASERVSAKQRYEIQTADGGSRMLQFADLAEIRAMITYWNSMVNALTPATSGDRRGRRTRSVAPA